MIFSHSFVLNNLDKKISFIFKLPCRLHWERFTLNFLGATLKRGFTYSRIFYFVCIYVSQSRASLIKVTSLNEADMVCWKNNLYGKTLARQKTQIYFHKLFILFLLWISFGFNSMYNSKYWNSFYSKEIKYLFVIYWKENTNLLEYRKTFHLIFFPCTLSIHFWNNLLNFVMV